MNSEPLANEIPENPLLRTLRQHRCSTKVFVGYVSAASTEGNLVVFPSLYDLSNSIEIAAADVLHHEAAPESVLPFGGAVLWVRNDAPVTRQQMAEATKPQHASGRSSARLRLRRRSQPLAVVQECWDPDCSNCYSPCSTCHSECAVCVSTCELPQPQ